MLARMAGFLEVVFLISWRATRVEGMSQARPKRIMAACFWNCLEIGSIYRKSTMPNVMPIRA